MRATSRTTRSSRDLVEESHVGIVENPDIGDVVAEHRDASGAHAECPAGVTITVESGCIHDRWMNHPRAQYLHPAGSLTARTTRAMTELAFYVHLSRRFGEREVARPNSRVRLAEESVGEVGQRRFEIHKADSFVDRESLDLCEHRRVGRVEKVAAVSVAGAQNPYRRFELLHCADLHRRSVRPEQNALAEVEGVVQVKRGVIGRKVERSEIVPLCFRLGPKRDGESQLAKNVLDLLDDERHRMLRAQPLTAPRHSEIDLSMRRACCVQLPPPLLEVRLKLRFDGIDQRACFAQFGRRERWQLLEELRQSSGFSSEERGARLFEQCSRRRRVDHLLAVSGERSDELLEFRKRHGSEFGWAGSKRLHRAGWRLAPAESFLNPCEDVTRRLERTSPSRRER